MFYEDDDDGPSFSSVAFWAMIFFFSIIFAPPYLFPDYFSRREEERQMEVREAERAYSTYLDQHKCVHVSHIVVSHPRASGTVYKQYQCNNGLFLEYEIRKRVRRESGT